MRQQNQKLTHVKHEFDPIFDENSEILILGTLPSVKSREQNFYYGHPQNRFWKVLAALLTLQALTTASPVCVWKLKTVCW